MAEKSLEVVVGILTGAEASHFFFGRLPSKATTRSPFGQQENFKQDNKTALMESVVMGSVLALLVAGVMKSWIVAVIAFTIMGLLALLYLNDIERWW